MAPAAAIYCRISEDREGSGLGVKRQEADCRALCERRGWTVAEVLIDNDVSAYRGKPRPGYGRLVEAVKAGDVGAIVAWHPDRLTRHIRELEDLIELVESTGVKVATVTAGDYDLSTASGRMVARMVGAAARHESEHKGERTKRKHLELARAGRAAGGGRPFGYEADRRTIRDDEAELVRNAAARVLAGDTIRGIVGDWNRGGQRGPRGGRWTQTALRRVLLSARIAGLRSLDGAVVADAEWPAIIDRQTHDRLKAVIAERGTNRAGFGARRYLLTGFLRCHKCDTLLIARPQSNRRRTYICTSNPDKGGCGGVRILAEPLEELIVEAVMHRLDSPALARALAQRGADDDTSDIATAIERDEAKLRELAERWDADHITGDEWMHLRTKIEARIDAGRRHLARQLRADVIEDPAGVRDAWPELSLDRRRAIIGALIDRIVIGPGRAGANRFDPGRVDIAWRS